MQRPTRSDIQPQAGGLAERPATNERVELSSEIGVVFSWPVPIPGGRDLFAERFDPFQQLLERVWARTEENMIQPAPQQVNPFLARLVGTSGAKPVYFFTSERETAIKERVLRHISEGEAREREKLAQRKGWPVRAIG